MACSKVWPSKVQAQVLIAQRRGARRLDQGSDLVVSAYLLTRVGPLQQSGCAFASCFSRSCRFQGAAS